ncbi:MAG: hypothetical protein ACOVLE_11610, partial [Pirellula staleyi]
MFDVSFQLLVHYTQVLGHFLWQIRRIDPSFGEKSTITFELRVWRAFFLGKSSRRWLQNPQA